MDRIIRKASPSDAKRIAEIYAPYVIKTAITFENTPPTEVEMKSRIEEISLSNPYLVLEEDGVVTGYAYAHAYKTRIAYSPTVELSVYVDENLLGGGRGKQLIKALLSLLKDHPGRFTAIANITYPNERSEKMFLSLGFRKVSEFTNVGYKFGVWQTVCDYIYPLKSYDGHPQL